MTPPDNSVRKAAWILVAVIAVEGFWVVLTLVGNPLGFLNYLGFAPGRGGPLTGWMLAAVVTALYVWAATAIPAIREHLIRPTALKLIAIAAAVMAAVLEEVIFRRWIMDYLDRQATGAMLQVLASGAAFGLAHAFWGFLGRSFAAALQAMIATGVLGAMLGVVYLMSDRSLAPCIVAHFVVTALIEPGLVLAAVRGQLGVRPGNRVTVDAAD